LKEHKLAVVLATDRFATIAGVVERLRRQTVKDQIELIVVGPSANSLDEALFLRCEFSAVKIVEHPLTTLGPARAAGIRVTTSPIVFIGETHTFANPEFAEALINAFRGPWATVTPCFGNANPEGALSWAAYLSDYGRWGEGIAAGEATRVPSHNTAYRRGVLMGLGDQLGALFGRDDEFWRVLRASGHRSYVEPRAQLDHANVSRVWDWVRERFCVGLQVSSRRAQRWPWHWRLLYLAGSPLLPAVLTWRVLPGVIRASRRERLPWLTYPAVVAGMILWALGEITGYLGLPGALADVWMFEYEVRKLSYTQPKQV
jgi:hypothetical protein